MAVVSEQQPRVVTQARAAESRKYDHRGRPNKIFLATGRGPEGSLLEPRVGIKARIGIDMDVGEPIKQAWLFPDQRLGDGSFCVILSSPYSTLVLTLDGNLGDVEAETSELTHFDLTSRTLHAARTPSNMIIQITETAITLVVASQR